MVVFDHDFISFWEKGTESPFIDAYSLVLLLAFLFLEIILPDACASTMANRMCCGVVETVSF